MKDPLFNQKSLVYRFKKHVEAKGFFRKTGRYLIGCSGGADSVALFHLMRLTLPAAQLTLTHFNHGLRARTAKRDELFVRKLAGQYQVSFFAGRAPKKIPKKISIEEWARAQRYAFFKKNYQRKKYHALLLAHHADDQAETVLMRMCQGTGPRGLEAVRETMRLEKMNCIRPLLPFSKNEILGFLKENRFLFCEDETNRSGRYLRNRIRMRVLPYLSRQINPQVVRALARIPAIAGEENHLLQKMEEKLEKQCVVQAAKKRVVLRAGVFRRAHPALQFRVLDRLIKKIDPAAGLLFEHAELIKAALKKQASRLALPRGIQLEVGTRTVSITK